MSESTPDPRAVVVEGEPSDIPNSDKKELHVDERNGVATAFGRAESLDALLNELGVDRSRWGVPDRYEIRRWASQLGGGKVGLLHYYKVPLQRIPDWIIEPPKFPKIHRPKPRPKPKAVQKLAMVIPDIHIGFLRESSGHLIPMHDRRCLKIAIEAARRRQPDVIIITGDALDLAELGRFERPRAVIDTIKPACYEMHSFLRHLRNACPDAEIVWLEGNHDARVWRILSDAPALADFVPPGETKPLFSVERMVGMDKIKACTYVGPYSAVYPLWDGLAAVTHGDEHGKDALQKMVSLSEVPLIVGHLHIAGVRWRSTIDAFGRHKDNWAMSPGTFGIRGRVPSGTKGGKEQWQKALGWVHKISDSEVMPEVSYINDGRMVLDGEILVGNDDVEHLEGMWPEYRWREQEAA